MYQRIQLSLRGLAHGAVLALTILTMPTLTLADEEGKAPVAEKPPVAEKKAATRTIMLPREAFSIDLPGTWNFNQYGESVFSATRGDAQIWIYESDDDTRAEKQMERFVSRLNSARDQEGPPLEASRFRAAGAELALQVWYDESKETRVMAVLKRIDGNAYHVEGRVPAGNKSVTADVRAMISSINLTPYVNPSRHVDWKDGWTMDVPVEWQIDASEDDTAKFTSPKEGQCTIRVFPIESGGVGETPEEIEARAAKIIDDAVARLLKRSITIVREGDLKRGVQKMTHGPAGSVLSATYVGSGNFKGKVALSFECVVIDGAGALTARDTRHKNIAETARAITRTLRRGTHPGKRVDLAAQRRVTKFPAAYGPALRFVLPDRWSFTPPANKMRLAQIQIPGQPALWGTAYWFGKGQGGDKDANMARWKKQIGGDNAQHNESTLQIGNGIVAHTLVGTGTYQAAVRPGAKERENKPDHRMVTSFIECPNGPIMIKFVGPTRVVAAMEANYEAWLRSFTVADASAAKKNEVKNAPPKKETSGASK